MASPSLVSLSPLVAVVLIASLPVVGLGVVPVVGPGQSPGELEAGVPLLIPLMAANLGEPLAEGADLLLVWLVLLVVAAVLGVVGLYLLRGVDVLVCLGLACLDDLPGLGCRLGVVLVFLGGDGLGVDVLGPLAVLPWVAAVLVIVPFPVPRLVLQVLEIEGLIHHV